MTWDTVQQAVRLGLQFLGGYLVSKGILDEGMAATLTGGLLSVVGVGWWIVWDRHRVETV